MTISIHKLTYPKYRPDIDGLRALAVLPVILFHAGFELFSGGFVGVDVFFVISGYLITTIILAELDQGKFSIVNFYERRARRILPALFLVMLVCIPFAWFCLPPSDMKDFSKSITATSLFVSNILSFHASGYFDTVTELKPLIHTWSLAIEEQFYIIFPLLLILFWKLGKRFTLVAFGLIFITSLTASQYMAYAKPTASFFLLPTRAWELLIGAFIAFYLLQKYREECNKNLSELGGWLGVTLIFIAVFTFKKTTPFPGFYALVPTLGTALVIIFANEETSIGRLLGNKIFVSIGLISFSAYLWHQPLFAFARLMNLIQINNIYYYLIGLTFILAYITYKFVEQPFRKSNKTTQVSTLFTFVILSIFFASIGAIGGKSKLIEKLRFNEAELRILSEKNNRSNTFNYLGKKGVNPTWLLLGDSHANTLQEAFQGFLLKFEQSSLVKTIDGCPPALNLIRLDMEYGDRCHKNYSDALYLIKEKNIKRVLISYRLALYLNSNRFDNEDGGVEIGKTREVIYDTYENKGSIRKQPDRAKAITQELLNYINNISGQGVKVFLINSIPEVGWDVPSKSFSIIGSNTEVKTRRSIYIKRNLPLVKFMEAVSKIPNVTILKADDVFCDNEFCYATKGGIPLYSDSNHLTRNGANLLIGRFENTLNED